jgi:serine/threonine protein kinase
MPDSAAATSTTVCRAPPKSIYVVRVNGQPVRLGHGGNRGSCVYLVECMGRQRALKACGISHSELTFCAAVQQAATMNSGVDGGPVVGISDIALPLFVVTANAFASREDLSAVVPEYLSSQLQSPRADELLFVGIVMPLYDCSLHRLLVAPSVDVACQAAGNLPPTPASPSWKAFDSSDGQPFDEVSTSSDEEGVPLTAFHATARQRRVHSLVVIAALLHPVVRGLACLHGSLPHALGSAAAPQTTRTYKGFAHQDLRADNILVSRSGEVVLCDFELIGHFTAGNGALQQTPADPPASSPSLSTTALDALDYNDFIVGASRVGTRLLPPCFHPPEGPNQLRGDSWLVGLLAMELFTGVTPLIRSDVAFDDFGDGPLLHVDPGTGIGWDTIRQHVHDKIRPFPSAKAVDGVEVYTAPGYMDPLIQRYAMRHDKDAFAELHIFSALFEDFCRACLANDPKQRLAPEALAKHELFTRLDEITEGSPSMAVRSWVETIGSSHANSPVIAGREPTAPG